MASAPTTRPAIDFDGDFLKKLEVLNVIAKKIMAGLLRADRKSIRKGVSAEFADHRQYVAGDDPRYVDWHLFGRLEEVFLKLYREEENLHLSVLLDASDSMNRGIRHKLNYALQVSAALAYIGMSNMDAVNVLPFGARIGESRWGLKGRAKVFQLLDYLKSIEPEGETAMSPVLREFVGREFPAYADEMLEPASRRSFLKIMGASLALAGMTACRWPREEILPFTDRPEGYVPGEPMNFASALELGGVAAPVLVTSYDGRPIKIEGNPEHPASQGGTSAIAQAAIQRLVRDRILPVAAELAAPPPQAVALTASLGAVPPAGSGWLGSAVASWIETPEVRIIMTTMIIIIIIITMIITIMIIIGGRRAARAPAAHREPLRGVLKIRSARVRSAVRPNISSDLYRYTTSTW